jgi:2-amino-4-hydroxy-6-hydroxymethyldihydropteridine diphosphokinase
MPTSPRRTEDVFIGVGSNIGDSVNIVTLAIDAIGRIRGCRLIDKSSLYRSEALGDDGQDDYINAVAHIACDLQPLQLLLELQSIEHAYYRSREEGRRWAPRTLDLDIILFGNRVIEDSHLVVPHPGFAERRFVLEPLYEVDGDRFIPGYGSLRYLIEHAPPMRMEKLAAADA